jgi:GcrA cell cycle regulator
MANVWTDEKLEQLKVLAAEGLSAGQIARRLGGVSRSAVYGKIHRLKGTEGAPTLKFVRGCLPGKIRGPKPPASRVARPRQVEAEPSIMGITPETIARVGHCRWPIGDPCAPDFHYCGHKTYGTYPYCEAHAARAYQPRDKK